jgi:hypothetical protein
VTEELELGVVDASGAQPSGSSAVLPVEALQDLAQRVRLRDPSSERYRIEHRVAAGVAHESGEDIVDHLVRGRVVGEHGFPFRADGVQHGDRHAGPVLADRTVPGRRRGLPADV